MSAQTNALALGLGNVEVNSHLGQPLRASIQVQGASELKNVDCFRVVSDNNAENQVSSANLKLSKVVDDVAILTVTTNQVLNEPITNLSIAAECDANMRRDYVLLLDPPLTTDIEKDTEVSAITETAADNESFAQAATSVVSKTPQALKVVKPSKKATKSTTNKVANKEIVLTAGYSNDKSVDTVEAESKKVALKDSKPRLSISGGETSTMPSNNPQLRMDRHR
jgi:Tfp pilus assembly protein FimV